MLLDGVLEENQQGDMSLSQLIRYKPIWTVQHTGIEYTRGQILLHQTFHSTAGLTMALVLVPLSCVDGYNSWQSQHNSIHLYIVSEYIQNAQFCQIVEKQRKW